MLNKDTNNFYKMKQNQKFFMKSSVSNIALWVRICDHVYLIICHIILCVTKQKLINFFIHVACLNMMLILLELGLNYRMPFQPPAKIKYPESWIEASDTVCALLKGQLYRFVKNNTRATCI